MKLSALLPALRVQPVKSRCFKNCGGWSLDEFGDGDPEEIISVKPRQIDMAYEVMELMVTLAKIGETWSTIELLEEHYNQPQL